MPLGNMPETAWTPPGQVAGPASDRPSTAQGARDQPGSAPSPGRTQIRGADADATPSRVSTIPGGGPVRGDIPVRGAGSEVGLQDHDRERASGDRALPKAGWT